MDMMTKQTGIDRDEAGRYGVFGGMYVNDDLKKELNAIADEFEKAKKDAGFKRDFDLYAKDFIGRETPLYYAKRLSETLGGAQIYLKREDLCHTGAHKLNNVLGQIMIAKRLGKKRVIAETGAGQHGVATATACALFGIPCVIYMGREDTIRQKLNVFRMKILGAEVVPVAAGAGTLSNAVDAALQDLMKNAADTYYLVGSAVGPHPYPAMVKYFQSVIGTEARRQILQKAGRLPDVAIACVGGGSNAIGLFSGFENDNVAFVGVEAAGRGLDTPEHCATLEKGRPGVLHGAYTYLLQDDDGHVSETYSISAGLDYPGVGPEHSMMKDSGRATYVSATDDEAVNACLTLSRTEGIIPALESSHALAYAFKLAPTMGKDKIVLVNVSGRGDKDTDLLMKVLKQ